MFKLISEHSLWSSIQDQIVALIAIDRDSALRMMVNHVDELPITSVVEQLSNDRKALHKYLHDVFVQHMGEYNTEVNAEFHEMQVP